MGKNMHAVALGKKGGRKGGLARARNLTPEQLAAIGRKGAEARWGKAKVKGGEANRRQLPTPAP